MPEFNRFNAFVGALATATHNFAADTLKVALMSAANAPNVGAALLGDLVPIDTTHAGDLTLTTNSADQTAGIFRLKLGNRQIDAVGGDLGPFRYIALYNDSKAGKPLIGWYDIGNEVTIIAGQFIILAFNSVDGAVIINSPGV